MADLRAEKFAGKGLSGRLIFLTRHRNSFLYFGKEFD